MESFGKTVLIGTSLDLESDEVVRVGLDVAARLGAHPIVAHAFEPAAITPVPFGSVDLESSWIEMQREAARTRLERQLREVGAPSDTVVRIEAGSPFDLLRALAEIARVDLLVVGAHRGERKHPLGIGSTSERLARHGRSPLLVVRSGAFHPPAEVVFPVDCSTISGGGLRAGLELLDAMAIDRAAARALFVLHPLSLEAGGQFSPEQMLRFATRDVADFVHRFAGESMPVAVRSGKARQTIVEELSESGADLVVVPTRGLSGLERLMIGSVATGIVHDAPCNVLVIPAAIADAAGRRADFTAMAS